MDHRSPSTIRQIGKRVRMGFARAANMSFPALAPRRFTPGFLLGVALCATIVGIVRANTTYPTGVFDLYPLYYGAKAWLHSGNAYALHEVVLPAHLGLGLVEYGNGYPLPAVLLLLPLSFLPPTIAATLWVCLLTIGLLFALRINGFPPLMILYGPLLGGLMLEQYTVFVVILQLGALWAYRANRPWFLAVCCALILTKPSHGLIFVLALLFLTRYRWQMMVATAAIWGSSLLFAPTWVADWLQALAHYQQSAAFPVYWQLAFFSIPLLLVGDIIGGATLLQFLVMPFPVPGVYAAGSVPLSVLYYRRSVWLVAISYLWIPVNTFAGSAWAIALTLVLPMVMLSMRQRLRWSVRGIRLGNGPHYAASSGATHEQAIPISPAKPS